MIRKTEPIVIMYYGLGIILLFFIMWIFLVALSTWIFDLWLNIEKFTKGSFIPERNDFWGIIKVIRKYPGPIFYLIMIYMVIMPIGFLIVRYIWLKSGIIK